MDRQIIITLAHKLPAAHKLAFFFSVFAAAVGVFVLVGWALDITILKSVSPSGVTMKPNTALAVVISGFALALVSRESVGTGSRFVATSAAFIVMVLASLSLGESFFRLNLGIDQLMFREPTEAVESASPGRMAPQAAFCFLLIGAAVFLASSRSLGLLRRPIIPALGVSVILVGTFALFGYIATATFDLHLWNYTALASNTAFSLVLLGCALLAWSRNMAGKFWTLDSKVTGWFVIGAISILGIAAASYSFTTESQESARRVTHTQEEIREIEELTASHRAFTVSLGRYLITGDESAVADRPHIKAAIQEDIDRIRLLTADNPSQQLRISEIEKLTVRRNELSDQILAKVQQSTAAVRLQPTKTAQGSASPLGAEYPAVGLSIDHVLEEMQSEEYSLLKLREIRSESSSIRTFLLMPVGVFFSLTVLLLAMFYLNARTAEQKQVEDAHNALETYFRTIFEVTPDGILISDTERKIVMANPAAEHMFGHSQGALSGTKIEALVPETLRADLARERDALLEGQTETPVGNIWRARGLRKDGSTFPIEILRSALSTAHGSFILGVARDLTEREGIEESRSRMAAIVESSDDAIIGKDLKGIISSWNRGAEKIFGYSAAEMIGQSILEVVPIDRLHEEPEILRRIALGESIENSETQRQTKDGRLIDVSISVSPIFDGAGRVIGASKIARDVTASKHLEHQLRQSQKMEAIGQLTGGVAHDFNNLLGVVIGNLDFIERLVIGNEPAIKRVQNAQKAALRGADLTRRMLAFSRRQPLQAAPTSVAESVQNTIEMATRAVGPQITLTSDIDPSLPPILVDASQLENALLNLVVNARDAMPEGGSILISSKMGQIEEDPQTLKTLEIPPGHYVCISVSDTGHGMSRETSERVFEPFFTTKPRGKGTGLGLAMVYGFAKQSGGTARVYSELNYGTTVTLYLPRTDEAVALRPAAITVPEVRTGSGKTVLVVDDEADLLELAIAYLEEMGYRVLYANDGEQALQVLAREPEIDLLVTDIIMPGGMNGVDLARRVRIARPGVKIIYSSGFPSDALAQKSGTRIDGPLLSKPYRRDAFVAAVSLAMNEGGQLDGTPPPSPTCES